jgi:hypothetical protein
MIKVIPLNLFDAEVLISVLEIVARFSWVSDAYAGDIYFYIPKKDEAIFDFIFNQYL